MMNPEVIPIIGMITGIITTALFFWCVVKVAQSQIGHAISRRILGRHAEDGAELGGTVADLQARVDQLSDQVAEMHERLDFAERLLTQARAPGQLSGHEGA
jgi:hypothetical protein